VFALKNSKKVHRSPPIEHLRSHLTLCTVTTIYEVDFNEGSLVLGPPNASDPFIHVEWLISVKNLSTIIVFDIENSDGPSPAELTILQGTVFRLGKGTHVHLLLLLSRQQSDERLFARENTFDAFLARFILESISLSHPLHILRVTEASRTILPSQSA
jgi:hypothetical protein